MSEMGLVQILEGALMAAGEPLSLKRLSQLFDEFERPATEDIKAALADVNERCDGRGYELVQVASGYRFQVRQKLATWVGRLWQERPQRYSRALLETLSLIAYRQPITRGEIEGIRGVSVSSNIVKTLHEREWIRVVGHRDVPGRPAMYATTRQFLDYFNLQSLEDLPPLADIKELDNLSGDLELVVPDGHKPSGEQGGSGDAEAIADMPADAQVNEIDPARESIEDSGVETAPSHAAEASIEEDWSEELAQQPPEEQS